MTISDRLWAKMTARLALPDAARPHIECAIAQYQELDSVWKHSPSEVNKKLKRVSDAASKLADLLESLDEQEQIELTEAWPLEPSLLDVKLGRLDAAILRARTVSIACENVQASEFNRRERSVDLVERLDPILRQFLGYGVYQSRPVIAFLEVVFEAAKINVADRSIRARIKNFNDRGKKRNDNASRFATDSGRQ